MKRSELKGIKVKNSYDKDSLESVISKVYAENTLLFIGAGFSLGSKDQTEESVLLAKDLSIKICKLGDFDEDEDLAYSADYYLKYHDASALIGLLKNCFTVKDVSPSHEKIARVNWRRVYTTNYDNCFELASGKVGKVISPITLEDSPAKYFRSRDICIHINGAIQLLDNESLEKSFKLTESSYTNSDAFSDSSWAYRFKKDLEVCSQIIFVGYSLYDMEIKRLLISNEAIKGKTFFVTRENVSNKEHHRISSFGEVFPIGINKFAELIEKNKPKELPKGIDYLSSLQREEIKYEAEFSDSDVRDFLLRGKLNSDYIASSLTSDNDTYAIRRKQISESLDIFNSTNIIVIHGALANGKSVLARQIASQLLLEGKLVYTVKDEEADYEADIEALANLNQKVYLLIDDFERSLDVVRYFSSCLADNGKMILTERPHRYRRAMTKLTEYGLSCYCINVDYLHETEVKELANILSNTGLWGDLGGDSCDRQIRYLTERCESQISIVLLNLLKSSHVLSRFQSAFSEILKYPETKKAVYAICLIQHIYPSACKKSFISDIADSNHVYSKDFDDRVLGSGLFEFRGDSLVTRSSIFGTFILSSLYRASYSIDQMVRIVEMLQRRKSTRTVEESEIYRSIMTFGTLSAILPDDNKSNSYMQFYEKVKSAVPSVTYNPHYWLQYAMAVMSDDNLSDAEIILKTAYSKAENNPDYDTTYIDNQFARLNLKKAISEKEQSISIEYFMEAHRILRRERNDIYKFRQAGLYLPYYDEMYKNLSRKNKVNFEHALKEITEDFKRFVETEYPYGIIPPFQEKILSDFEGAIDEIKNNRGE